jgi:hypothetical protein
MRQKTLTYSNVMSTLAVFLALGGTSYAALKLPRNSVGIKQLKDDSVGGHELRARSVTSSSIRNGSVGIEDVSPSTRTALRGDAGPPGPAGVGLRASVTSSGAVLAGNPNDSTPSGVGKRLIGFPRDVTGCTPTATLARNPGGTVENPGPGSIVVAIEAGKVAVETYDAAGTPTNLPFNLLVAC